MKLQQLIQKLSDENSKMGEITRMIKGDKNYHSFKNEQNLKEYLSKKMNQRGMIQGFAELLSVHELINQNIADNNA